MIRCSDTPSAPAGRHSAARGVVGETSGHAGIEATARAGVRRCYDVPAWALGDGATQCQLSPASRVKRYSQTGDVRLGHAKSKHDVVSKQLAHKPLLLFVGARGARGISGPCALSMAQRS